MTIVGVVVVVAAFVIYLPAGQAVIDAMSNAVLNVMAYSRDGIEFIFRGLAQQDGEILRAGSDERVSIWSFAVNVLPIIIFFSALMSVLYHLQIMQVIVKAVGGAIRFVIGTRAVESLNAAANIFIGQTEAPLVVRPYLRSLTDAQWFAIMVSGVASIAGTVLLAYVLLGAELKYLVLDGILAAQPAASIGKREIASSLGAADVEYIAARSESILSISTIPLLIITPAKLSNPRIPKKSKGARIMIKPIKAPVKARGMVIKMISGLRKELNCQIKSTTIPKMHIGIQRIILPRVSALDSISPPTSRLPEKTPSPKTASSRIPA